MKFLISALCFLGCMVAFGMSHAASIKEEDILFKTGVYSPVAAVDGWRKFLEKERPYISKEGLPHHKQLVDGIKKVEEALIKNEHVNTLKLLKIYNALSTQLLPHIKNERAHRIHSEIVDAVNKLIADGAANKLGKDDMHNFIRESYKSISAL